MRRALVLISVAAVVVPSTTARAAVLNRVGTTCGMVATDLLGGIFGPVAATVVAVDTGNVSGNPATATITCRRYVNGFLIDTWDSTPVPGGGVLAAFVNSPRPDDTDVVTLCTTVSSSTAPTTTTCADAVRTHVVPQPVCDPCPLQVTTWVVTPVPFVQ